MKTINFYSDGGHGWAKVKREEIERLGISEKITAYSYQSGEYVYLEEDCDFSTYLKAFFGGSIPENWRDSFKMKEHYSNKSSKIRNYSRYSSQKIFELRKGVSFILYGNQYKAIQKIENYWMIQAASGARFKLKKAQLCDCREVKQESEAVA